MGKLSLRQPEFKRCVKCGAVMEGVYSYTIRRICSGCGGKAETEKEEKDDDQFLCGYGALFFDYINRACVQRSERDG